MWHCCLGEEEDRNKPAWELYSYPILYLPTTAARYPTLHAACLHHTHTRAPCRTLFFSHHPATASCSSLLHGIPTSTTPKFAACLHPHPPYPPPFAFAFTPPCCWARGPTCHLHTYTFPPAFPLPAFFCTGVRGAEHYGLICVVAGLSVLAVRPLMFFRTGQDGQGVLSFAGTVVWGQEVGVCKGTVDSGADQTGRTFADSEQFSIFYIHGPFLLMLCL